jgi:uncharacterized DUF497 family protein
MQFTWDRTKERINYRKHGISFEVAKQVFSDPFHLVVDNDWVDGEQRMMAIGTVRKLTVVVVVFVDRSPHAENDSHHFRQKGSSL